MAIAVNVDVMLATDAICKALDCQPGDLLEYRPDTE
ncbi:MAG TPA: helix-turn-helix domain-containing protein [Sphingomicrobium sp.]|nr:helix-turn-helix domain-containing protein [Sphingomicrobium sp.]